MGKFEKGQRVLVRGELGTIKHCYAAGTYRIRLDIGRDSYADDNSDIRLA